IGNDEGIVVGRSEFAGGAVVVPGTLIGNFAVEFGPAGDFFSGVDERKDGAWVDLNVGVFRELEHSEGVGDLFVAPLIATDDGDAQRLNRGRLQQQKHGLLIGSGRAARVLVKDDFAARLRRGRGDDEQSDQRDERATRHGTPPKARSGGWSLYREKRRKKRNWRINDGG